MEHAFKTSQNSLREHLTSKHATPILATLVTELVARHSMDLMALSSTEQYELLSSRAAVITPPDDLRKKLELGTPLKIKFGIDPTGADLHLGHAVPMIMASRLQRMGHQITLVIGDFTAKIGDPSGRNDERPPLTDEQIEVHLATYTDQYKPFFDFSRAEIVRNGTWLGKMSLAEFFRLLGTVNVSESLQREDFRKRLETGHGLSHAEFLYSILQGIDSAQLKNDIELGGIDQLLNLHAARKLMEAEGIPPQVILTSPLLPGTTGDGRKMSKTYANFISLRAEPADAFGKIMSIPDTLLETYFTFLTSLTDNEWLSIKQLIDDQILHPMELKKTLATTIVTILSSEEAALAARASFEEKFSKKNYHGLADVSTYQVAGSTSFVDFLVEQNLTPSKSEVRRLAEGGGLQWVATTEGQPEKILDANALLASLATPLFYLKIGKRTLVKVEITEE